VSVIPRGSGVGGLTLQLPREDKQLFTRSELLDRLAVLIGGRVAEELIFKEISTGAVSDLERATKMAYRMVVEFGMSERIGPFHRGENDPRRGPELTLSDETAREIDLEVRAILRAQEERVRELLRARKRHLAAIARVLRDKETMDGFVVKKLLDTPVKSRVESQAAGG
jgi:cell division protease FtsH